MTIWNCLHRLLFVGGVVGPVIGGGFESPARNYPTSFFAKIKLFEEFPYLLPCLIAAFFLATGAILSIGLSWDGGPKRKRIALPIDKDEALQPSETPQATVPAPRVVSSADPEAQDARRASRMSIGAGAAGGAHGYGTIRRKRESMAARASRRESMATVRINEDGAVEDVEEEHVSLARRLLFGESSTPRQALSSALTPNSQRGKHIQHQRPLGLGSHCGGCRCI